MVDAAKRSGRVVQIGFQRRQSIAINQARDYIREGRAGRIVEVGVQIHYTADMKDWKPQDPPPTLDWDTWCGPAPKLPYSPNIGHFAWRLEATTGHGHLVDWGIHLIDATRRILGEKAPRAVQAAGGLYYFKDAITTPDILTAHFDFETCPVVWRHRIWGAAEESPRTQNGIFFHGEKETVFVADGWWMVIPRDAKAERKEFRPEGQEDMGGLHVKDFLEAVRTRKPTACDVEDGYHSSATVQLGMVAYRTGSRVVWNAKREEIEGNPEAAKLLKREYRSPWKHPYPG
jgi:predicted dehydrogenase